MGVATMFPTYGQTYDVKSDFYNDYSNAFDARHVPALYVPKAYSLEKSGYAPAAVYANNANGYAIRSYDHGYAPKTYGQTYDVKSDFYNDYSNAFDARHVPAMMVPKVYAAEKSGYAAPVVLSNAAPAVLSNAAPAVFSNAAPVVLSNAAPVVLSNTAPVVFSNAAPAVLSNSAYGY